MKRIILLVILSLPFQGFSQESIDFSVQGISDGNRSSKQQDRDEAILDAKVKAIEQAGVSIQAITTIENYQMKKDWIESKAAAIILPGFQIIDVGYGEDGLYHVVMTGKVAVMNKTESEGDKKYRMAEILLKTDPIKAFQLFEEILINHSACSSADDALYQLYRLEQKSGNKAERFAMMRAYYPDSPYLKLIEELITKEFEKTYGGSGTDRGLSLIKTSQNDYLIVGTTYVDDEKYSDFYVLKVDSLGQELWSKSYGGKQDDEAYSVVETQEGCFIIAGVTRTGGLDGYEVGLNKISSEGDELWHRNIGGGFADGAFCIQRAQSEGYIVSGWTKSFSLTSEVSSLYLVRIDGFGKVLWDKTFIGGVEGRSVIPVLGGGYIVAGSAGRNSGIYMLKTDLKGKKIWDKTIGGTGAKGYAVVETSGGFAVTGVTDSHNRSGTKIYLLKTDLVGNVLWSTTFSESLNYVYVGRDLKQTSDGGFIITGWIESSENNSLDVYVVKTDSRGNLEWESKFGGLGDDKGYSVIQESSNTYVVVGSTNSFGAGDEDIYLIKFTIPEISKK